MSIEENKVVFITTKKGVVVLSVALLLILLVSCASQQPKEQVPQVLLILREQGKKGDVEFLGTSEAIVMIQLLEEAGFKTVLASASGVTFSWGAERFETLKLADVNVSDYEAFIIPSANRKNLYYGDDTTLSETAQLVKRAMSEGKLIAAKRWGIVVLAEAGVLEGRQYAFPVNPGKDTRFDNGIFLDDEIVQDENVITSNKCPYADPGVELTEALIAALQE